MIGVVIPKGLINIFNLLKILYLVNRESAQRKRDKEAKKLADLEINKVFLGMIWKSLT